jgi:hypothetical protein
MVIGLMDSLAQIEDDASFWQQFPPQSEGREADIQPARTHSGRSDGQGPNSLMRLRLLRQKRYRASRPLRDPAWVVLDEQ